MSFKVVAVAKILTINRIIGTPYNVRGNYPPSPDVCAIMRVFKCVEVRYSRCRQ